MKDIIVNLGLAVLGALIVVGLVYGMMLNRVEDTAKKSNERMIELNAPISRPAGS